MKAAALAYTQRPTSKERQIDLIHEKIAFLKEEAAKQARWLFLTPDQITLRI
jgi:hypothetical protein